MSRSTTLLSAGSILVLIGSLAPAALEAEVAGALVRAQSATRADPAQTRDAAEQSDILSRPVTLDLVDTPLSTALETIARLAGFTLAYNADILPAGRTVTLRAADLPAVEALTRVLEGTGLEPTMIGTSQLTLVRQPDPPARPAERAPAVVQQAIVAGTVTDEATGAALRGVQVRVDESELSTVTDAEGRYTLEEVPPGTHTLVARIIGYREGRQEVTVTAGTTASADFALAVSAVPLDEVIVTGTMVPTQMRAVPSPVSVITAEDIERKGVVAFQDVLRTAPGIGITGGSLEDYVTYVYARGASTLRTFSTIKTYIDGVEVAFPEYSLNQIDPSNIERVELVRGPQASTLYGAEALAGVLQVFTKKGRFGGQRPRLQLNLSGGFLESPYRQGPATVQKHTVAVSGGEPNLSYNVGISYRSTGEWVEDELIEELAWDVQNSATSDLGFHAGFEYVRGSFTAKALARVDNKSTSQPLSHAIVQAARDGRLSLPYYTKPAGHTLNLGFDTYGLTVNYAVTPQWQHTLTVGHDGTTSEFRQRYPRETTPADTFLIYQFEDRRRRSFAYNTAFRLTGRGPFSTTLQAGADLSTFEQRITGTQDAKRVEGGLGNQRATLTRGHITNHGLFAQAQMSWRDKVYLTAGLRADRSTGFGADQGYAWSPRGGIAYALDLGEWTSKVRASVGTAIRPPEPGQKIGQSIGNTVYLPNERLGAQTQSGYDVGFDLQHAADLTLSATYYDQRANDLIGPERLSDPTEATQILQYKNIGRIKNTGWEFEGTARVAQLTMRAHYSLMSSKIEQLSPTYTATDYVVGDRPRGVPRSTGGLSATYSFATGTVTIGMTHKGGWREYRWIPYYEALVGTSPGREPYRGSLGAYIEDYPAVQRYEASLTLRITRHVTSMLAVNNLLNDSTPQRWDIDVVKGRQLVLGVRIDSEL